VGTINKVLKFGFKDCDDIAENSEKQPAPYLFREVFV